MKRANATPPTAAELEASEVRVIEMNLNERIRARYRAIADAAAECERRIWSSIDGEVYEIEVFERARDALARYRSMLERRVRAAESPETLPTPETDRRPVEVAVE
jgi:hypothetical protein